jgi:hypothetical protein
LSKQRKCIFCGGTPVTKEHYLGKSFLQRIFAEGQKTRYDFYRSNFVADKHATEKTQFVATEPDVTATCACGPCNSGWMNDARCRIEPLIEPMIRGAPNRVTKLDDIVALSNWATQVGLCAAYRTTDIATELAPGFYKNRVPPAGHIVRFAQAVTTESTLQVMLNVTQLHSAPRHVPTRVEGYTVTIRVDHLILQVFCPPAGHETDAMSNDQWDSLTVSVWPLTFESIDWPWPPLRPLDSIDFHFLSKAYLETPTRRDKNSR